VSWQAPGTGGEEHRQMQAVELGRRELHPATALGWFTDSLGFATYHPGPGE
jgi:hypothetical protein